MITRLGRRSAALGVVVLLLGAAGCGQQGCERYIPSDDAARRALETVLANLERGQPPDAGTTAPVIKLVDSRWKPGQQLNKHQIIKEESVEGHTVFSVLLVYKGGQREQLVRYVVVGVDPLWVYREEDFHSAGGM
jgi:hypothetical protein